MKYHFDISDDKQRPMIFIIKLSSHRENILNTIVYIKYQTINNSQLISIIIANINLSDIKTL